MRLSLRFDADSVERSDTASATARRPVGRRVHGDQSRLLANAAPDPDFKYRSKLNARSRLEKAK
jgi:hypothetical protein